MPGVSIIEVHLYDGTRNPLPAGQDFLITTRAGGNSQFQSKYFSTNPTRIGVPFHDNADDNYTVLASLKNYEDAGFMPVLIQKNATHAVHLMLISRNGGYQFAKAPWTILQRDRPKLFQFLDADPAAAEKYSDLKEQPKCVACLLNICTAVESLDLIPYFKSVDLRLLGGKEIREGVKPDRFYAWVDPALMTMLPAMRDTSGKKLFQAADPSLHGPTATVSYKELRFDEANLQFTFHEKAPRQRVGSLDCVKVEMDIDYYKDGGAHFFLEVIPNAAARKLHIGPGLTDPRMVYAMRWMAAKNSGEEFNPLYEIA